MSEEKIDPKEGEEKQPSGAGQPEKKETTDDSKDKKPDEEKVEISKSELEKLQKVKTDFDGMVEADKKKNRAGRTIPGEEPTKKEKDPLEDDDELKEEFVTKKDYQKQIEKSAITEVCKDPIIDEHYDAILEFLIFRPGERDTVEGIKTAFDRASKVYKSEHPTPKEDKEDDGAKATADLAKEEGLGKGKERNIVAPKKSILPKNETMGQWYK